MGSRPRVAVSCRDPPPVRPGSESCVCGSTELPVLGWGSSNSRAAIIRLIYRQLDVQQSSETGRRNHEDELQLSIAAELTLLILRSSAATSRPFRTASPPRLGPDEQHRSYIAQCPDRPSRLRECLEHRA